MKESSTSWLVFVGPKGGREEVEEIEIEEELLLEEEELGVVTLLTEVAELAIEELVDETTGVDEELEDEDEVEVVVLEVDRVNAKAPAPIMIIMMMTTTTITTRDTPAVFTFNMAPNNPIANQCIDKWYNFAKAGISFSIEEGFNAKSISCSSN